MKVKFIDFGDNSDIKDTIVIQCDMKIDQNPMFKGFIPIIMTNGVIPEDFDLVQEIKNELNIFDIPAGATAKAIPGTLKVSENIDKELEKIISLKSMGFTEDFIIKVMKL